MKGELYEYKGEKLTQASIAKREGINRSTLADWYKKTGNMVLAVEGAKKSLAQRNIEYNGEVLSLKAIADKEKIKFESLKKYYDEVNDIYEAVKLTKEAQVKRKGYILYNGSMMTILGIATKEGIVNSSLKRYYDKTKDIYEAVRLAKEAQDIHNGTIEYKGKKMSIAAIASLEGIKHDTLKEFYDLYKDIYKAVFITKESQLKRKKALIRGRKASYEVLSRELDISVIELDKMVKRGVKLDSIKKPKRGVKKGEQLRYDDESLYRYCLYHSYNYWVINYLIHTYNKSPEEAIQKYLENGQQIPKKWIYEKYNLLFKHLTLKYGLDSNRIVKIMKDNSCGIEEAIQRLVFVTNNKTNNFRKTEIEWMLELYSFIKELTEEEYLNVKESFFITDREGQFLFEKGTQLELINRQLLLFDFANIIDEWSIEELSEIMNLYNITEEEKITIVIDLYSPFEDKVINPTSEYLERKELIRSIIINNSIDKELVLKNNNLTEEEKNEIIKKKELLNKILNNNIKKYR